jgi:hypothetical protein
MPLVQRKKRLVLFVDRNIVSKRTASDARLVLVKATALWLNSVCLLAAINITEGTTFSDVDCLKHENHYKACTSRMASSGMLRRVALVRSDVSVVIRATIITVTRIGELPITLAVLHNYQPTRQLLVTASVVPSSPILVTLMKEALSSSKTSVLTRATRA